ncbi:hypothetical protein PT974_00778 [Cladobotryum mycophilum]|uniref:DUF7580 domain-containing protein n=1 Tax=Cladobotryum mycophilum TaxID=491253 RepID=A0ABR0T1T4_9HYPO
MSVQGLKRITDRTVAGHQTQNRSSWGSKLAELLEITQQSAIALHQALSDAIGEGCHVAHEVKLALADDVIEASWYLHNYDLPFNPAFKAIYVASDSDGATSRTELPIRQTRSDRTNDFSATSSHEGSSRSRQDKLPAQRGVIWIKNLCDTLRGNSDEDMEVVLSNNAIGTRFLEKTTIIPRDGYTTISLNEVLASGPKIPREYLRLSVAVHAALNLAEFSRTEWRHRAWTKDSLCFLAKEVGDKAAADGPHLDIDFASLYVPLDLNNTVSGPSISEEQPVDLEEFGILLLEIRHQKTLEARFPDEDTIDRQRRGELARDWLKSSDTVTGTHGRAIWNCLRSMTDSGDDFLAKFSTHVILLLYQAKSQLEQLLDTRE